MKNQMGAGMVIDYSKLRKLLLEGVTVAWTNLISKVDINKIRVFSIDPSDLGTHVSLCADIEDSAAHVLSSLEQMERLELRWSMPDWEYAFFETTELNVFNAACSLNIPDPYQMSDRQTALHIKKYYEMCISILKEMDSNQFFGSGVARDSIILGIILTDQSDRDMVKYVKALNPPSVAEKFQNELRLLRKLQRKHDEY